MYVLYVCVYVCMYVCMGYRRYLCHVCILHWYLHIHTFLYLQYQHKCMSVCMYVRMWKCMYVCIYYRNNFLVSFALGNGLWHLSCPLVRNGMHNGRESPAASAASRSEKGRNDRAVVVLASRSPTYIHTYIHTIKDNNEYPTIHLTYYYKIHKPYIHF